MLPLRLFVHCDISVPGAIHLVQLSKSWYIVSRACPHPHSTEGTALVQYSGLLRNGMSVFIRAKTLIFFF